jgi:hypothetical protein
MPSATSISPEITEPSPPILPNTPVSDATRDTQYRVLYDFRGQVESEHTVQKGDLVLIVLKEIMVQLYYPLNQTKKSS